MLVYICILTSQNFKFWRPKVIYFSLVQKTGTIRKKNCRKDRWKRKGEGGCETCSFCPSTYSTEAFCYRLTCWNTVLNCSYFSLLKIQYFDRKSTEKKMWRLKKSKSKLWSSHDKCNLQSSNSTGGGVIGFGSFGGFWNIIRPASLFLKIRCVILNMYLYSNSRSQPHFCQKLCRERVVYEYIEVWFKVTSSKHLTLCSSMFPFCSQNLISVEKKNTQHIHFEKLAMVS